MSPGLLTALSLGLSRIVGFCDCGTGLGSVKEKNAALSKAREEALTLQTLLEGPHGLPKDAPVGSVTDTLSDCAEAMANCLVVMGQYGAEESSAYRITEHRLKVANALLAKLEAARV